MGQNVEFSQTAHKEFDLLLIIISEEMLKQYLP
jgi:hypothetical protein